MSNAQVLYLQHLITKKLRQEQVPRKLVAHQNLRSRLQPLVREAENEISGSQGALIQVIEEAKGWLESGNQRRMQVSDQDISMRVDGLVNQFQRMFYVKSPFAINRTA